jgi:hypothetical protein
MQILSPLFLEPTTGRRYSMSDCPYEGVEAIWNTHNYWVCMQLPEPHSDARAAPSSINWDLKDVTKWEAVLSEKQTR